MKVIIAGSRTIDDVRLVQNVVIDASFHISEVVSGCARGIDQCGEKLAKKWGVPVKKFSADWNKHGRAAGPIRNAQMAEYADALIAIWDGSSRGTLNMIQEARREGLDVYIHRTDCDGGGR